MKSVFFETEFRTRSVHFACNDHVFNDKFDKDIFCTHSVAAVMVEVGISKKNTNILYDENKTRKEPVRATLLQKF
jgi:hypothetical protein